MFKGEALGLQAMYGALCPTPAFPTVTAWLDFRRQSREVPPAELPIAAVLTSRGRAWLHRLMSGVFRGSAKPFLTDSNVFPITSTLSAEDCCCRFGGTFCMPVPCAESSQLLHLVPQSCAEICCEHVPQTRTRSEYPESSTTDRCRRSPEEVGLTHTAATPEPDVRHCCRVLCRAQSQCMKFAVPVS